MALQVGVVVLPRGLGDDLTQQDVPSIGIALIRSRLEPQWLVFEQRKVVVVVPQLAAVRLLVVLIEEVPDTRTVLREHRQSDVLRMREVREVLGQLVVER